MSQGIVCPRCQHRRRCSTALHCRRRSFPLTADAIVVVQMCLRGGKGVFNSPAESATYGLIAWDAKECAGCGGSKNGNGDDVTVVQR